jgi:hypothetical protein
VIVLPNGMEQYRANTRIGKDHLDQNRPREDLTQSQCNRRIWATIGAESPTRTSK